MPSTDSETTPTLNAELQALSAAMFGKMDEATRTTIGAALDGLVASDLGKGAPSVGDSLESFELPAIDGTKVRLSELLQDGPVIVQYVRGGWCPYCNLQLQRLARDAQAISGKKATLVVITPEKPEEAEETGRKNTVPFPVLVDAGLEYAKKLDLAFSLPDSLKPVYKAFGLDLEKANGADNAFLLPVPATFVVGMDGKIRFRYVNPRYSERAEPADILAALA
eukprot:m.312470 g.312470  ORF g.312470 m.312470 type:complete len:223 (-) comp30443_c0_seq1:188-856(-)